MAEDITYRVAIVCEHHQGPDYPLDTDSLTTNLITLGDRKALIMWYMKEGFRVVCMYELPEGPITYSTTWDSQDVIQARMTEWKVPLKQYFMEHAFGNETTIVFASVKSYPRALMPIYKHCPEMHAAIYNVLDELFTSAKNRNTEMPRSFEATTIIPFYRSQPIEGSKTALFVQQGESGIKHQAILEFPRPLNSIATPRRLIPTRFAQLVMRWWPCLTINPEAIEELFQFLMGHMHWPVFIFEISGAGTIYVSPRTPMRISQVRVSDL